MLRPVTIEPPKEQKETLLQRKNFYGLVLNNSLLVSMSGIVFVLLLFIQVISIDVTSSSDPIDLGWQELLIYIVLSAISMKGLKFILNFQNTTSKLPLETFDDFDTVPRTTILRCIGCLAAEAVFVFLILAISEIISDPGAPESLHHLVLSGEWFSFFLLSFLYVLLSGAVTGLISVFMIFYLELYPHVVSLQAWFRRVLFFIKYIVAAPELDLETALSNRCSQCCSSIDTVEYNCETEKTYCQLCGQTIRESGSKMDPMESPSKEV